MIVQRIENPKLKKVLIKKVFAFMIVLKMILIFMNIKINVMMTAKMEQPYLMIIKNV